MGKGTWQYLVIGGSFLAVPLALAGAVLVIAGLVGGGSFDAAADVTGSVETVDSLPGKKIPYKVTKLGSEEHLDGVHGGRAAHCHGPDANPLTFAGGGGAYPPHTPEQERWYFNEMWPGNMGHVKLLITSKETKKSVVVSVEEAGPAPWVTARDGIGAGAPPEVFKALGLSSSAAYTGNPNDGKNEITVKFVKDQKNAPLGPVGKNVKGCQQVR